MTQRPRALRTPARALALLLVWALCSPAAGGAVDQLDLRPHEPADFGLRNIAAGATSIFGAWGYWYRPRVVEIETVPADASLELFFIRANFQKRFERAAPPVRVTLPSRVESTPKDSFMVRVAASGYSTQERVVKLAKLPRHLLVKLDPLPNTLVSLAETHLAGRTALTLRTDHEPELRVLRSRGQRGFTLALSETANGLEEVPALSGGWVDRVDVKQVGEDLLITVATRGDDVETRSRSSLDPVRREYVFTLELLKKGTRPPTQSQIRHQLEALRVSPDSPCVARYEAALRERLDPKQLARALRSGGIANLYRREAMLRLGRLNRGRVTLQSGETLRTGSPVELEVALQSGASVSGYLALLDALARTEREPEVALRSLVAPDLDPKVFDEIYRAGEAARHSCG